MTSSSSEPAAAEPSSPRSSRSAGSTCSLLEAGPRCARHRAATGRTSRAKANNPASGLLPLRPVRPQAGRRGHATCPSTATSGRSRGVGGTTLHYFGNCPRALPGVFAGRRRGAAYDRAPVPVRLPRLIPYYEWVEDTLPGADRCRWGRRRRSSCAARASSASGADAARTWRATAFRPQENAILQPRGLAGRTDDPRPASFRSREGCTFCGHCLQGCIEPLRRAAQPEGQALDRQQLHPDGADRRRVGAGGRRSPWSPTPSCPSDRVPTRVAGRPRGVTWRDTITGERTTEERAGRRARRRAASRRRGCGSTAACPTRTTGSAAG